MVFQAFFVLLGDFGVEGEGMGLLWLQLWGFLCKFVDY